MSERRSGGEPRRLGPAPNVPYVEAVSGDTSTRMRATPTLSRTGRPPRPVGERIESAGASVPLEEPVRLVTRAVLSVRARVVVLDEVDVTPRRAVTLGSVVVTREVGLGDKDEDRVLPDEIEDESVWRARSLLGGEPSLVESLEPSRASWLVGGVELRLDGEGKMPRVFNTKVFGDVVTGTSAVYTPAELNQVLATGDRLVIQAVSDQVPSGTPTLTVQIEHSGDQKNWINKNGTAEINAVSLSTTATTNAIGNDPGTNPTLGFVRLRIQMAGVAPVSSRLNIYVCGRTK